VGRLLRTGVAAAIVGSISTSTTREEVSLAKHERPYHVTTEMPGYMAYINDAASFIS
jgi:hypothetical protein